MYGAILGDIIGQPYGFGPNNIKTKDFSLFTKKPRFTDDSVMTVAICDGILTAGFDADEKTMKKSMIEAMHKWGNLYPNAGYGGTFIRWFSPRVVFNHNDITGDKKWLENFVH